MKNESKASEPYNPPTIWRDVSYFTVYSLGLVHMSGDALTKQTQLYVTTFTIQLQNPSCFLFFFFCCQKVIDETPIS